MRTSLKGSLIVYTQQILALSLVLAISMVGISYGASGNLPGDGLSESTAYLIEDLADFDVFADPCNSVTYWSSGVHTKLTCDPNLTGRPYTTAVIAPDTPDTGSYFDGIPFEGIFDGNDHAIRNLTIDTVGAGNDYLGLFGCIEGSGAEIKNLGLENINITGGADSYFLGGLCGFNGHWNNPGATISNCYATGSVTSGLGSRDLGGLCGYNRNSTITNCYATVAVAGGGDSICLGGLFGSSGNSTITNCYATGSITGGGDSIGLGGLFGGNDNSTITNCYATGSITGGSYLGGLCGENYDGVIVNCYATGLVTGGVDSDRLGGLCGSNSGDTINCYATGSVTGGDSSLYLGGLCGYNPGTITNCYATGLVTGGDNSDCLGGLCGWNYFGTITNCYATGAVTGDDYLGGLCGENGHGTIINCFWDVEISGMTDGVGNQDPDPAGVIGKTTSQMQTQSTFADAGWVFADYQTGLHGWYMPAGSYPLIYWQNLGAAAIPDVTNMTLPETQTALTGAGLTLGNVFYINSWQIPEGVVTGLSAHIGGYVDTSYPVDIYISAGSNGDGSQANPYEIACQADLDAVNNNLSMHYIMTADIYLGYHITYTTAVIAPDTSTDSGFQGTFFTGVFDGNSHIVSNLTIVGDDYLGLFGRIEGSGVEIKNLGLKNVNIVNYWYDPYSLGGLCGYNYKGTITNCYVTGAVAGGNSSDYLGGLCGRNYGGTITNCYATSSVTGGDDSYGLGGLCGGNSGTITNCFWDTQTSGMSVSDGGTGKTTVEMQTESTFTDVGWDFSVVPVWHMPFEAVGYPMLGWQKDIPGDFTGRYGVGLDDWAILSDAWLSDDTPTANWNEYCDLDGSGVIEIGDLEIFVENWLCD